MSINAVFMSMYILADTDDVFISPKQDEPQYEKAIIVSMSHIRDSTGGGGSCEGSWVIC